MRKNGLSKTTDERASFDMTTGRVRMPKVPSVAKKHKTPTKKQDVGGVVTHKNEMRKPRREAKPDAGPVSKEIRQLQKNARNKEYRMRRLGVSNESVAFASPRVAMTEVRKMTTRQRQAYAAKLKAFNARENKLSVAAYEGTIKSINAWAGEYNKSARKARKRIESIPIDYSVSGAQGAIKPISEWKRERGLEERDPRTGKPTGRVFVTRGQVHGSVSELSPKSMTKPKDLKAALRREQTVRNMAQLAFSERRRMLRDSVDQMIRAWGDDELADKVKKLTAAQFDVLIHETNFMAEAAVAYSPFSERQNKGQSMVREVAKGGEGDGDGTAGFQSQKDAATMLVDIVKGAVR